MRRRNAQGLFAMIIQLNYNYPVHGRLEVNIHTQQYDQI